MLRWSHNCFVFVVWLVYLSVWSRIQIRYLRWIWFSHLLIHRFTFYVSVISLQFNCWIFHVFCPIGSPIPWFANCLFVISLTYSFIFHISSKWEVSVRRPTKRLSSSNCKSNLYGVLYNFINKQVMSGFLSFCDVRSYSSSLPRSIILLKVDKWWYSISSFCSHLWNGHFYD